MKKLMMAVAMVMGLMGAAQAATVDQLTITLTPNVNANVAITTTTVRWQNVGVGEIAGLALGSLDLGATVYMIQPATFTMTGTFAAMEVSVEAVGYTMGAWSFDADGTANEDALQVYSLMSAVTEPDAPALTDYANGSGDNVGDQIITTDRRYGQASGDDVGNDSIFQEFSYNSASENLASGAQRHMWLRADLPPSTSDTGARAFAVMLTAQITD